MQEVLIRDVFGLKNTSLQIKLDILDVLLNYRKEQESYAGLRIKSRKFLRL